MAQYKSFQIGWHGPGCECCTGSFGSNLAMPRKLAIEEVESAARQFSTSILKNWTRLNAIVKRFERCIQKRWIKKGLKQRRELLLAAWPKILSSRRPELTKQEGPHFKTYWWESFLWPYINLEDLQQRHLLLLFINSRGRHIPETFRIADVKSAELGIGWVVDDHYCEDHTLKSLECEPHCMLFRDVHSPSGYGKVIDLAKRRFENSEFKFLSRSPEGLLSLEIQNRIYNFLLTCVELILHDVEPKMFGLAPHQQEPAMPRPGNTQWSSLTAHSVEAFYRLPRKFDFERLKMLVSGRRKSAEDHIWMLREDPAYFIDTLRDWNEHNGRHDSVVCDCRKCYSREAGRMIQNAFVSFVLWDDVYRLMCKMAPIETQLKRVREQSIRLAARDEIGWMMLMWFISLMICMPTDRLSEGLPTRPRLRSRYRWTGERWVLKSRASKAERRVYLLFFALFDLQLCGQFGWYSLVQETQYLMESDVEANQYIDSWLASHISDLVLITELLRSIDSLAPYLGARKTLALLEDESCVRSLAKKGHTLVNYLNVQIPNACASPRMASNPINKNDFDYPAEKRPSRANVNRMRSAEQRLDMFWQTLEEEVFGFDGLSLEHVFDTKKTQFRELYRTPAWQEPMLLQPTPETTPQKRVLTETDADVGQFYDTGSPKMDMDKGSHSKEKVKTRGTPTAPDHRSPDYRGPYETTPPATPAKQAAKIKTSKKAYEILCTLLPSAGSVVQRRREIAWDDFLFAMDAIGLGPEKLYGSVWMFRRLPKDNDSRKVDVERSIQFHAPREIRHGHKIAAPMVRTFGRRLKHAFGWTCAEDMFEIK